MLTLVFLSLFVLTFSAFTVATELTFKNTDNSCEVFIDGKPFAVYLTDYQGTPILYPIHGPGGQRMTRDFPMRKHGDHSEEKDHPHHRSLWFNHGNVNGNDFWFSGRQKIVHQKFLQRETTGKTATIITANHWMDKKEQILCNDVRTLRFGQFDGKNGHIRFIDFDIMVKAVQKMVVFGDTKEGTFGIRVSETMKLTAKKGGHIVNAEGLKDEATWGKRSAWTDYYGPVEGKTAGIAVLNHPSSFRFPTYWHIRGYGLFAANPFGVHDFESQKDKTLGEHLLKEGESFTLRYRVLLHDGTDADADIKRCFQEFAEEK